MMYYDRECKRISKESFLDLMRDVDYPVLARTEFKDGITLVTMWVGFDPCPNRSPPNIFETRLCYPRPSSHSIRPVKHKILWESEARALKGHNHLIKEWMRSKPLTSGELL